MNFHHAFAAAAMAISFSAVPASAVSFVNYAQFTRQTPTSIEFTEAGGTTTLSIGDTVVSFIVKALGPVGSYPAVFSGSAFSDDAAIVMGSLLIQTGFHGSFSFVDGGTNYLTVDFSGATFTGTTMGSSGSFFSNGGLVNLSSNFLDVSNLSLKDFAISYSGLNPGLSGPGTYTAALTGTFSAVVPEPATWGLLITGFGMVGFAARRRRAGMASITA